MRMVQKTARFKDKNLLKKAGCYRCYIFRSIERRVYPQSPNWNGFQHSLPMYLRLHNFSWCIINTLAPYFNPDWIFCGNFHAVHKKKTRKIFKRKRLTIQFYLVKVHNNLSSYIKWYYFIIINDYILFTFHLHDREKVLSYWHIKYKILIHIH